MEYWFNQIKNSLARYDGLGTDKTMTRDIIHFSRPINCAGLCCGILYPFCTQALSVSVNGESAGMFEFFFKMYFSHRLFPNLI